VASFQWQVVHPGSVIYPMGCCNGYPGGREHLDLLANRVDPVTSIEQLVRGHEGASCLSGRKPPVSVSV